MSAPTQTDINRLHAWVLLCVVWWRVFSVALGLVREVPGCIATWHANCCCCIYASGDLRLCCSPPATHEGSQRAFAWPCSRTKPAAAHNPGPCRPSRSFTTRTWTSPTSPSSPSWALASSQPTARTGRSSGFSWRPPCASVGGHRQCGAYRRWIRDRWFVSAAGGSGTDAARAGPLLPCGVPCWRPALSHRPAAAACTSLYTPQTCWTPSSPLPRPRSTGCASSWRRTATRGSQVGGVPGQGSGQGSEKRGHRQLGRGQVLASEGGPCQDCTAAGSLLEHAAQLVTSHDCAPHPPRPCSARLLLALSSRV